jgi:hypothetical protein
MKVDKILIFLYFQVNKNLKYVYVLSNCTYYNHYISKKYVKINLNTILTSKFQSYLLLLLLLKSSWSFYSIYHKPNGRLDAFIFLLIKLFYLFFNVNVKNCFNYKLDFF